MLYQSINAGYLLQFDELQYVNELNKHGTEPSLPELSMSCVAPLVKCPPLGQVSLTVLTGYCGVQTWGKFRFVNFNSTQFPKKYFKFHLAKINSNSNFLNCRLRKNSNPINFNTVLFVLEIMCAQPHIYIYIIYIYMFVRFVIKNGIQPFDMYFLLPPLMDFFNQTFGQPWTVGSLI